MFTNLKRIINFALADFYRNKGISVAVIFILTIITMLVTGLFLVQGMSKFLIEAVQNKIDITAYFKPEVQEQAILEVRDEIINASPEVKDVEYISKEKALDIFRERHKDNPTFEKALTEVGENPFLPSLNITTAGANPAVYEQISNILQSEEFDSLIEKVDFSQKRDTIEKVFSITSTVNTFGVALSVLLALVAGAVVFSTVKLMIDNSREEISIMRIVGASNWFVQFPFVIEGAIFGLIAFGICLLSTGLLTYFLSPSFLSLSGGFDLFDYFISRFWIIVLIQLVAGTGLGALCSFVAVRKYLRV